jgi:hypothetical protein
MFGLVITIIGIAVFSLFMAAGTNYVDSDRIQSAEIKATLHGAVSQYASGVVQFNLMFGKDPTAISDFSPSLIDSPKMPDGFSAISVDYYDVPSVGTRLGICYLASSVEYPSYLALANLKEQYSESQLMIVSDCSSLTEISAPLSYPSSFNFIYLIRT